MVVVSAGHVGGTRGSGMIGLCLGFTNPMRTGGVLDVCLCMGCSGVGGGDGEWVV